MPKRSALFTRANSGIGNVIASRLAYAGHDGALNHKVDGAAAQDIAQELHDQHGSWAIGVYADVGNGQDVDAMFRAVLITSGA